MPCSSDELASPKVHETGFDFARFTSVEDLPLGVAGFQLCNRGEHGRGPWGRVGEVGLRHVFALADLEYQVAVRRACDGYLASVVVGDDFELLSHEV